MQSPHPTSDFTQGAAQHLDGVERALGPDVRRTGQPAVRLLVAVRRQQVGPLVALELETVFQKPEELVRGDQVRAVLAGDVPAGAQCPQSLHGAGDAQVLVRAPVHHLQELDGELHVAQPTPAELEFALPQRLGDVLLDTAAHGLHVVDEVLALGRGPHHGMDRGVVVLRECEIAGHGPGLEQRLELPGLGPARVVGGVGLEGTNQLACLALGPQRRVDLEERHRSDAHHLPRQPGGLGVGGLGHEDHVDVRDVVELPCATLAHRHHGQPGRHRRVRVHRGHSHGQRGREGGVGEVGQSVAHLVERQGRFLGLDGRGQVVGRQQRHLIPIRRPQDVHRCAAGDRGPVGADAVQVIALRGVGRAFHRRFRGGLDGAEHVCQDRLAGG